MAVAVLFLYSTLEKIGPNPALPECSSDYTIHSETVELETALEKRLATSPFVDFRVPTWLTCGCSPAASPFLA